MNISTLLPIYCRDHQPEVDEPLQGLITSFFEIAYILSSPLIGWSLKKVGRKNYIILGYIIVIIGTIGFGLLRHITNTSAFIGAAMAFRFI